MNLDKIQTRYLTINKKYYPNTIVAIFDVLYKEFQQTLMCPFCDKESNIIYRQLNIPLQCDCKLYQILCNDVAFYKDPLGAMSQM